MTTKSLLVTAAVALVAGAAGAGITVFALEGNEEGEEGNEVQVEGTSATTAAASMAQISDDSARVLALIQVPGGKITDGGIETEDGKLLYSFDISVPGKEGVEEVHIDAMTGALLAHEHESDESEETEKADKTEQPKDARKGKGGP